jgi:hypothetical protein
LFKTDIGQVEKYINVKHGIWEIYIDENGKPHVRKSAIKKSLPPQAITDIQYLLSPNAGIPAGSH